MWAIAISTLAAALAVVTLLILEEAATLAGQARAGREPVTFPARFARGVR